MFEPKFPISEELVAPIDAAVPNGVTHIGFIATNIQGHLLVTEPEERKYGTSATFSKIRVADNEKPHETLHRCFRERIGHSSPIGIYPIPAVWVTPSSRHFYFAGMLNLGHDLPSTTIHRLGWCDIESAKNRISQSRNAASRERDLALISAVASMCLFPARRVLLMVHELHLMGFERLRAPAYNHSMAWRCPIVPTSWTWREHGGMFDKVFFHIKELLNIKSRNSYSSKDEQRPFGWNGVAFASPRDLALRFLEENPEVAMAGWGPDNEYAQWFQETLEMTVPNGVYYAFSEEEQETNGLYTVMTSIKRVPLPPPGCAKRGEHADFLSQTGAKEFPFSGRTPFHQSQSPRPADQEPLTIKQGVPNMDEFLAMVGLVLTPEEIKQAVAEGKDKPMMAVIFKDRPQNWGYRGDPHLWDDMEVLFKETTWPDSEEEVVELIESAFMQLTGSSLASHEDIFVPKYDKGGMSSGMISMEFWRNTALPILKGRYTRWNS